MLKEVYTFYLEREYGGEGRGIDERPSKIVEIIRKQGSGFKIFDSGCGNGFIYSALRNQGDNTIILIKIFVKVFKKCNYLLSDVFPSFATGTLVVGKK